MSEFDEEYVLGDDYPVYADYFYIVDGAPERAPITGTIAELKSVLRAKEVRRCNIIARMAARQNGEGEVI